MFSQATKYAVRAMIYIAHSSEDNRKVGVKEIAEKSRTPEAFIAKILQKLSKENLLSSQKGPSGGFYFTAEQLGTSLCDIVECLEGKEVFTQCGMGFEQCSAKRPCPVHYEYSQARTEMRKFVVQTTIGKLLDNYKKERVFIFD